MPHAKPRNGERSDRFAQLEGLPETKTRFEATDGLHSNLLSGLGRVTHERSFSSPHQNLHAPAARVSGVQESGPAGLGEEASDDLFAFLPPGGDLNVKHPTGILLPDLRRSTVAAARRPAAIPQRETNMREASRAEPAVTTTQRLLASCRLLSLIIAGAGIPSSAVAHPGAGIAVDRRGQVYFLDTGSGLWRIDSLGRLTHLSRTLFHWVAIDDDNRFADTRLPSGAFGEIVKVGRNPTVLLSSDYPIAIGKDGNLYYQSGAAGSLRLMRMTPSGATSVVVALPPGVNGKPLLYISGLTAGPDSSLYYTEDAAIRRIDAQGRVSTIAVVTAPPSAPSIPATEQHPYLRGLAVSDGGVTYVCDTGDARLLRMASDNTIGTVLQTQSPWSPTAVALYRGDLYVLEFLHTTRDVRRDWLPRVRKIASDGTSHLVVTIDQMPGAR